MRTQMLLKACGLMMLLFATTAIATKLPSNLPVTTYLSEFNAAGVQYYVFADSGGAYQNGVAGVGSYLNADGYNHITWGDWRLDLFSSTSRSVAVTFSAANAVQPSDPGYTAPANPPYWGTQWWEMHLENKCTGDNLDMLTMKPGDKFT